MVAQLGPVPASTEQDQTRQNVAIQQLYKAINNFAPLGIGGYAANVDLNSANTDSPITVTFAATCYYLQAIVVRNKGTTASLTTATAGVFTAAAAGGTTIAPNQSLASITSASANTARNMEFLTLSTGGIWLTTTTLYFRVGTAQGAAATADVYVVILPLP